MTTAWAMLTAVLIDTWLGEPSHAHPLVGFGRLARWLEARLYADRRDSGVCAWLLAVVPLAVVAWCAEAWLGRLSAWAVFLFNALVLYAVIGLRSLADHAIPVASALRDSDIARARQMVGRMVSRDTQALDEHQVAAATTESVLENGNDAIFGALSWFAVLGARGRCCTGWRIHSMPCGDIARHATRTSAGQQRASTMDSTMFLHDSPH